MAILPGSNGTYQKNSMETGQNDDFTLDGPDAFGNYPIITILNHGDNDLLEGFLKQGGNPNIDTGEGWTPLHYAVDVAIDGMIQNDREFPFPEKIKTIQLLLKYGADSKLKNNSGETALESAGTYGGKASLIMEEIFRQINTRI